MKSHKQRQNKWYSGKNDNAWLKQPNQQAKTITAGKYWVYFIQEGNGAIKIGLAVNVQKRLYAMQTGNSKVLRIIAKINCEDKKEALLLEKQMHRKFKHYNIRGEWFSHRVLKNMKKIMEDVDYEPGCEYKPKERKSKSDNYTLDDVYDELDRIEREERQHWESI